MDVYADEYGRPLDVTEIDSCAGLTPEERAVKEAALQEALDRCREALFGPGRRQW